jgi:hypothetical protein
VAYTKEELAHNEDFSVSFNFDGCFKSSGMKLGNSLTVISKEQAGAELCQAQVKLG